MHCSSVQFFCEKEKSGKNRKNNNGSLYLFFIIDKVIFFSITNSREGNIFSGNLFVNYLSISLQFVEVLAHEQEKPP